MYIPWLYIPKTVTFWDELKSSQKIAMHFDVYVDSVVHFIGENALIICSDDEIR